MKAINPFQRKALVAAVCMMPLTGFAADAGRDLSYGYLEVDYINLDIDQPGEGNLFEGDFDNGGGYGISASLPITEQFFVFGDWTETESDFGFVDNVGLYIPGDVDIKRLNLGAGFAMPLSTGADIVVRGAYVDIDYNSFNFGATSSNSFRDLDDDPSDGWMADVAWRAQWSQSIEGSLGVRYTDIESVDNVSFIGNVLFELSPNWGINLQIDAGDDLITYGAGVRMTF
jgi:hypothetical protein